MAQSKKQSSENYSRARAPLEGLHDLVKKDPLSALDGLENYLKNNLKTINRQEEMEVYYLIGQANFNLGQLDLAIENYERALNNKVSKIRSSSNKLAIKPDPRIFSSLGEAYGAKEDWPAAISYFERFVKLTTNGRNEEHATGLFHLGRAYLQTGNLDQASNIADQVIGLSNKLNYEFLQPASRLLKGEILEAKSEWGKALVVFQEALELAEGFNNDAQTQQSEDAIGRVLKQINNYQSELSFKKERLQRSTEQNDLNRQNTLNLDIADIYISNEQEAEALPYLENTVQIAEELGDLEQNIKARKSLSDVYADQGDYNSALVNYQKYVALVDTLYDIKQKEIELSARVQQDVLRKQNTINTLEKDLELDDSKILLLQREGDLQEASLARQRLLIYGLMSIIGIILVSAIVLYRNVQQKKTANQLLALKSLRSQMNPHFIFNALNSVNSFISMSDTRKANKYLSDFSKLMRTVMENSQQDFVPLSEEIATLELYLKLEHFRFQDKFDYELFVDPDLPVDEYKIPPMLVQPYIENAIWHGLRYKEEKGVLKVTIARSENELLLSITDNGIGRKKSLAIKTANQKTQGSTGMKNTANRIQLINDTYKSRIKIDVKDLNGNDESGTLVKVHIPLSLIEESY
ncbi:MAG: tetratricopeptide repeat-containing sensor histidine kinase [Cyclobacteriaceae bacterium]